ncbi:unnamed protein product, partial [Cuscuta campestris]
AQEEPEMILGRDSMTQAMERSVLSDPVR